MVQQEFLLIVVSAFSGAIATFIIQEVRAIRQRKRRLSNIRRSLAAEIEEGEQILYEIQNPNAASGDILPSATYEAVSDEIGLLTPSEAGPVIRFYSRVKEMNSLGRKIDSLPREDVDETTGISHHIVVDCWRRARSKTLSAADTARQSLLIGEIETDQ